MYDLEFGASRASAFRRPAIFHDFEPPADDFLAAVIQGLSRARKALPCRYLYDQRGSELFDAICQLPEYYPTRTEIGILRDNASDIAGQIGRGAQVVELGSGSSTKVRILLDALDTPAAYVPIDISRDHLKAAAQSVQDAYPEIRVEAVCADFSQDFALPARGGGQRVGFYPGSTIGNFTPLQAKAFLADWSRKLGQGALMLIGVDLRKDPKILQQAYDDAQGVTAAFSLNLLARANRELGADFDLGGFRHEARYLADEGRVVINLRSTANQTVQLCGHTFHLAQGETIHIEDSWKYTAQGFRQLAASAGFAPLDWWTDTDELFSVHLLEAQG